MQAYFARATLTLAFAISAAAYGPASATTMLPPTTIFGSLEFAGVTGNFYDPNNGFVPSGFGNSGGLPVTLGAGVEFGAVFPTLAVRLTEVRPTARATSSSPGDRSPPAALRLRLSVLPHSEEAALRTAWLGISDSNPRIRPRAKCLEFPNHFA
jgi:hypothetical protein